MTGVPSHVPSVQPVRPPAEPPPSRGDLRAVLAAQYLAGSGIEIGALHSPLHLPEGARARYVDRFPVAELRRQYPTLADLDLVEVDVVDDGERLSTIADGSLDFIVASHFLEHCEDPIGTIGNHLDKLAPGGVLFYVVPDKRYTSDVNRPVTSWTQAEFLALLLHCRSRFSDGFDIEIAQRHLIEVIAVLRKAGAPREFAGAPPLTVGMLDASSNASEPSSTAAHEADDGSAALRTEIRRLQLELKRVVSELEVVRDHEAEAVAEHHHVQQELAGILESQRRRPLARARARVQRLGSSAPEPQLESASISLPLSALRADLVSGWPEGAWWRHDGRIPGRTVTAMVQPVETIVRYRLTLPPGSRVRADAALSARIWREAGAGATAILRFKDGYGSELASRTARLTAAVEGGEWTAVPLELGSEEGGSVVLELEARREPAETPVPQVLWGAPQMLVRPEAVPHLPALHELRPTTSVVQTQAPDTGPLISILTPVHDPEPRFLELLLEQMQAQSFNDWELCLVDDGSKDHRVHAILEAASTTDPRIRLHRRTEAGGISVATNDALRMARGAYVALLDHDDMLAAHALQVVADRIASDPSVGMLYSDEDHVTPSGQRFAPYRKPDWAPDTLRSQMYTCHLGVYRRDLALDVGGFRPEFDGSQDYDFVLRMTERTQRIRHVPQILYHWRVHEQSASSGPHAKPYAYDAARRALQAHLDRTGVHGVVELGEALGTYRVNYESGRDAAVEIVLPVASVFDERSGSAQLVRALAVGGHERWQIVLAGPEPDAKRWARALEEAGLTSDRMRTAAGEAAAGPAFGHAVRSSQAHHMLFLDDAVAAVKEDWMRALLGVSSQPGVGAVGAKVLAPDGRVEHAGVVVGHGLPLPVYHGATSDEIGHLGTLRTTVNRSAVAGVVMAPRSAISRLQGLNESLGSIAIVDYCLRACETGLRVVWTPDALVTLASAGVSGWNDLAALAAFRERWEHRIHIDPFYNQAFWQERADFTVTGAD